MLKSEQKENTSILPYSHFPSSPLLVLSSSHDISHCNQPALPPICNHLRSATSRPLPPATMSPPPSPPAAKTSSSSEVIDATYLLPPTAVATLLSPPPSSKLLIRRVPLEHHFIRHQIFEDGHLTLKVRHGHFFCNSEQLYSVLNGGDTENCYTPSVLRNSKILSALTPGGINYP
ncbi:unnamed protein product [Lactuca virosa]|uniref:Uncharacterized protein n=1 Tax=Lactuca virosa TaxID=75947 RepID=A0AAU9NBG4_9ASTR|nr:unnamed protein product [Lactuca virosa]